MGFDLCLQALPGDCELLRQVRTDYELGELLARVPYWFRSGPPRGLESWPEAQRVWGWMVELERQFPNISQRNLDLERAYDQLHYLLSANRRGDAGDAMDGLMDVAIRGGAPIGQSVRGGQGCLVRSINATEVADIADLLDCMTSDDLMGHFNPVRMEAQNVYKFQADRVTDDGVRYLEQCFMAMQRFYRAAAQHGEDVIVVLD